MGLLGKEALIIDDDQSFRLLFNTLLKNFGIVATEAESISTAFQALEARAPHFIFLDLELRGEKGLDFLEKISSLDSLKNIPIVVVSSSSAARDVHQALALGAKDYVIKPVQPEQFAQKLRKLTRDAAFLNFDLPKLIHTTGQINATAIGIGEKYLQLRSSVKFEKGSQIDLAGTIRNTLSLKEAKLQTSSLGSLFSGVGLHITNAELIGISEDTATRVKQCIEHWDEMESNHPKFLADLPYPKVAMIDDEQNFCLLAQKLLTQLGIQVEIFSEPDKFLDFIKATQLTGLLIDLNIGQARTGFKLVEAIRRVLGPYIPIYIVSGEARSELISEAIEIGSDGYIYKAQDPKALSERFSEFLLPKNVGQTEGKLYLTPKELSQVKISFPLSVTGGDELGLRFVSEHLAAKNTPIIVDSIQFEGQIFTSHPLSFVVKQNWVESRKSYRYGFYAEVQENGKKFSELVRTLMAKMGGLKVA